MSKKKKLSIRLYEALFPPRTAKRSYAASRLTNQNSNWTTAPTGANYERRTSLAALRARARQASRDNGIVKNWLEITRSNVIGPKGIRLQSRATMPRGTMNVTLNQKIEAAWREWGHAETCTLSGKLDWKAVQRLVVTQLACDGEFLVQMVDDPANPFGFSLKVWDVNWLDETYNETRPGGNRVIMSVEIDANDKPVAYWLTTPSSEINFTQTRSRQRTRIAADQMIHGFLCHDDETQVRGVTWLHAGLLNAKNLQSYEEGVIQSARMAANVFGFIEQATPDGEEFTGLENEDGTPTQPVIDVSNLSMNLLNPGQKFTQIDPKQPTQNHAAFMKTESMGLGASLSLPYFLLFGDWEATNFSSSRGGLGEARQMWKGLQEFIAVTLCRRVYREWLMRAWLTPMLEISARDFESVQNPKWIGRGWEYINPTQDAAADVMRLQNRLATPSEILAAQGVDYSDFLDRWDSDRKLAAAKGIEIDELYNANPPASAPAEPANEPDDDETPPADAKKKGENAYLNGKYSDEMLN